MACKLKVIAVPIFGLSIPRWVLVILERIERRTNRLGNSAQFPPIVGYQKIQSRTFTVVIGQIPPEGILRNPTM